MLLDKLTKKINLLSLTLLLFLITQVSFSIWSIDKGFDFSDEAFSYLGFKDPLEIHKAATYYTHLYNAFFSWSTLSIVQVRVLRVLLQLTCAAALGLGLLNWLLRKKILTTESDSINLFLFLLIGGFLVNANGSQSFTYNMFSTLLYQASVGIFMCSFQSDFKSNRVTILTYLFQGALLFALFAVKFSNAFFLGMAYVGLIIYDTRSAKILAGYCALMLLGACTTGVLIFQGYSLEWLSEYIGSLMALGTTSNASILSRYVQDYKNVGSVLIWPNLTIILVSIFLLVISRLRQNRWLSIVVGVFIVTVFTYVNYTQNYYLGGYKYIYTVTFYYILLATVFLTSHLAIFLIDLGWRKQLVDRPKTIIILFLFVIPILGSFGTNNLLSVQIIWYAPFLLAGLFLLIRSYSGWPQIFIATLGITATIQSLGMIYSPYRINGTLFDQTVSLVTQEEHLKVDSAHANSFKSLRALIINKTTFRESDPIFAFRLEYGFIYLLRGTLPGWSWYKEETSEANCSNLKKTKLKNLGRTTLILPTSYSVDSLFSKCLQDVGILFPDNYVKLGETSYRIDGSDRPLSVYAPKNLLK